MAYVGDKQGRVRHGHGTYHYSNAFYTYTGDWVEGKKHGKGKLTLKDGTSYEGDFVKGEITGVGLKRWPDGSSYSGEFHLGELHGQGVFLGLNGEMYEGAWHLNFRHGHGILQKDGMRIDGIFENHFVEGHASMDHKDGTVYEGEWHHGEFNGRGKIQWGNGDMYHGEWEMGKRAGEGEYFHAETGLSYKCAWVDDHPEVIPTQISSLPHAVENTATNSTDTFTLQQIFQKPIRAGELLPEINLIVCDDSKRVCLGEIGRLFRLFLNADETSDEEISAINSLANVDPKKAAAKAPAGKGKGKEEEVQWVDEVFQDPGEIPEHPVALIHESEAEKGAGGETAWRSQYPPPYVKLVSVESGRCVLSGFRIPKGTRTGKYTLRVGEHVCGPYGPLKPIIFKIKIATDVIEDPKAAKAAAAAAAKTSKKK